MRILITNHSLGARAGTELVVYELARALQRRGHQVAAYSSVLGEMAEMLRAASIPVLTRPENGPWVPDLIHGQHHLDTMTALLALPTVPAVYHTHGGVPYVERPPLHPRILHYIAMCRDLADTQWIELSLRADQISAVHNWVDLSRFVTVRPPSPTPKTALLFGGGLSTEEMLKKLSPTFEAQGVKLESSSGWSAEDRRAPELALSRYDIVLGSGRSALEAMACGCAVIVANPKGCLGWVRTEPFFDLQRQNFSPKRADAALNPELITTCLATYDADAAMETTALVRENCTLDQAADQLCGIYEKVVTQWEDVRPELESDPTVESKSVYEYLRHLATAVREVETLQVSQRRLQSDYHSLTKESQRLTEQVQKLEEKLGKGQNDRQLVQTLKEHWLGRLALSLGKRKAGKVEKS